MTSPVSSAGEFMDEHIAAEEAAHHGGPSDDTSVEEAELASSAAEPPRGTGDEDAVPDGG